MEMTVDNHRGYYVGFISGRLVALINEFENSEFIIFTTKHECLNWYLWYQWEGYGT